MVVDGEANIVLLHEFLNARQRGRLGIAGHNHVDACALRILELGADIVVFVLGKIHGAHGVQLDAVGGVVGHRLRFLRGIHGQMILRVLAVQIGEV